MPTASVRRMNSSIQTPDMHQPSKLVQLSRPSKLISLRVTCVFQSAKVTFTPLVAALCFGLCRPLRFRGTCISLFSPDCWGVLVFRRSPPLILRRLSASRTSSSLALSSVAVFPTSSSPSRPSVASALALDFSLDALASASPPALLAAHRRPG